MQRKRIYYFTKFETIMKLDNVKNCIKWVRLHTPFAIKPTRISRTSLVNPFTSGNAFDVVTNLLGEELFKQLNSK